ncbi:MAG: iron-sulfur cluster assembly scaffold protein [Candidatus Hodarchaeota archaeon]
MPLNFDKFTKKLQNEIFQKDIEEYNKKIVNLFYNPKNWGRPPKKEITVFEERRNGPKRYFLGLYLKIENNSIIKANFITDGCGVMVAIGSQLTLLIKGKTLEFANNLKPEDISNALMGIPPNEEHCTDLAINTLRKTIKKYKHEKKF